MHVLKFLTRKVIRSLPLVSIDNPFTQTFARIGQILYKCGIALTFFVQNGIFWQKIDGFKWDRCVVLSIS